MIGTKAMREIAIIYTDQTRDINKDIISRIPSQESITIFRFENTKFEIPSEYNGSVKDVIIPQDLKNRNASVKNFVLKHYFDNGYKGFLDVIEDGVEILKDPTEFMDGIETMMAKLKLKHWFNTITDVCNYTFTVYNPRCFIEIDKEDAKKVYDKKIFWTSHSNTFWVCYDLSKATYDEIKFEDRLTVPMFYIIEFLARRRSQKGKNELIYMNFYPTIEEEMGVFRIAESTPIIKNEEQQKEEKQRFDSDNQIFQQLGVNNSADMSIEQLIEDTYATLMS